MCLLPPFVIIILKPVTLPITDKKLSRTKCSTIRLKCSTNENKTVYIVTFLEYLKLFYWNLIGSFLILLRIIFYNMFKIASHYPALFYIKLARIKYYMYKYLPEQHFFSASLFNFPF